MKLLDYTYGNILRIAAAAMFFYFDCTVTGYVYSAVAALFAICDVCQYYALNRTEGFWLRHYTTVIDRAKILTHGFNHPTQEHDGTVKDHSVMGQEGKDRVSFSFFRDGCWATMVEKVHGSWGYLGGYGYIYFNLKPTTVKVTNATLTNILGTQVIGMAPEVCVDRKFVNEAIENGEYTINQPEGWGGVDHIILALAALSTMVSLSTQLTLVKAWHRARKEAKLKANA